MEDKRFNNDGTEIGAPETITPIPPPPPPFERKRSRLPRYRTTFILIIAGLVLVGAGMATGTTGGMLYFDRGFRWITNGFDDERDTETHAIPGHIQSININTQSINVIVRHSTNPRVEITGADADISMNGDVLNITATREDGFSFSIGLGNAFAGGRSEVRIYLNKLTMHNLNITTSSGRIDADDLHLESFTARSNSGRINAQNLLITQEGSLRSSSGSVYLAHSHVIGLNIETRSGRIELNHVDGGITDISSSSGSVQIDNSTWHNLRAETSSGRVGISRGTPKNETAIRTRSGAISAEIIGGYTEYNYSFTTSSGTLRVDGQRIDGGRTISGGLGNKEIRLSTSSGSARLNFVR